jgi:hypothetical protein
MIDAEKLQPEGAYLTNQTKQFVRRDFVGIHSTGGIPRRIDCRDGPVTPGEQTTAFLAGLAPSLLQQALQDQLCHANCVAHSGESIPGWRVVGRLPRRAPLMWCEKLRASLLSLPAKERRDVEVVRRHLVDYLADVVRHLGRHVSRLLPR